MEMKKNLLEKGFVIVMFVLVLVVFSFAERDTKKLIELHSAGSTAEIPANGSKLIAASLTPSDSHQ